MGALSAPRGLSEEEAQAWEKVAATVTPFATGPVEPVAAAPEAPDPPKPVRAARPVSRPASKAIPKPAMVQTPRPPANNLDSHWDRRLKAGGLEPDLTLDLHGHGLDAAYTRLMGGLSQARAMGARTILLVTGKPRPVDPADRGQRRGAIRAKVLDWLAASPHHGSIAAVRNAHRKHGGEGALYIVLRRSR